jgi:hypothetical protein
MGLTNNFIDGNKRTQSNSYSFGSGSRTFRVGDRCILEDKNVLCQGQYDNYIIVINSGIFIALADTKEEGVELLSQHEYWD